ncbi:MAG: hypothetical protein ACRDIB_01660, partial [Ardenticatenaceae bacterium]
MPRDLFFLGFVFAAGGSWLLLAIHFLFQREQRRDILLLVLLALVAFLPAVAFGVTGTFSTISTLAGGALLALPAVPLSYLFVAYRRQLGGLELRANRLVSLYLFLILLGTVFILLVALADMTLDASGATIFIAVTAPILAALTAVLGFPPFQRRIERHLLGIPQDPKGLVMDYASRLSTSLDRAGFIDLLSDEVLPSLLVRESALVLSDGAQRGTVLYCLRIDSSQLPTDDEVASLMAQVGRYRPPLAEEDGTQPCPWVRLALPLRLGEATIGLWLLGRRDPDDFYSQGEIPTLQALADQSAIALAHLFQTESLRALHQANMGRLEAERIRLAHGLHDEVLNDLAALVMTLDQRATSPHFRERYQALTARIRAMIRDLRPAMLNYGL